MRRPQTVLALGTQQDFVGERAAERADASSCEIGQAAEPAGVRVADGEDLAKRVIRNRRRHRRRRAGVSSPLRPMSAVPDCSIA